jgi:hypothetical protein
VLTTIKECLKPFTLRFGGLTTKPPRTVLMIALGLLFLLIHEAWKHVVSASPGAATKQVDIQRARMSDDVSVHAAGRGNPWINLSDGHELITSYSGQQELT